MSKQPLRILIMGRANVGKSTLVNRLLGEDRAITFDSPGVTRDINRYPLKWKGREFEIMDSGGVLFETAEDIQLQAGIDARVKKAMDSADCICFVTDAKAGLIPVDEHIAKFLRPYQDKVCLLVNKVDDAGSKDQAVPFYELGLGEPWPISALNKVGIDTLLGYISKTFKKTSKEGDDFAGSLSDDYEYKVSILGRPNVGKSSLINAILDEDLLLVDNRAGTTRDTVPLYFERHGHKYLFVDTAGMRKQAKIDDGVEYYSVLRTKKSILDSDLIIFVTDPEEFMCEQDRKIINMIIEEKRNMIVFMNKWDTTARTDEARKNILAQAYRLFPALENYPIIVGSAHEKVNLGKLLQEIPVVVEQGEARIGTSELNQFVERMIRHNPPPSKRGERVRIYYATQVEVNPPTFVFFINRPKAIAENYRRFLENRLREAFGGYLGNTIDLQFRAKQQSWEDRRKAGLS